MEIVLSLPNSNSQCMNFCSTAAANGRDDQNMGRNLKMAPWIDAIEDLEGPIRDGMVVLLDSHSTRREETALRNKSVEKMAHTVRDFRSGLTRRVVREDEPEYVLSFYQMPNIGFTGNKTAGEWCQLAESLVTGEKKAVAKGFPVMTNPSVEDLLVCMASFEERRIATDVADRNYREAQTNMGYLRKQVRLAARGLATTLRILLDDENKSTVRRAMRGYGFRFYRNGAEAIDETPQPNEEELPQSTEEELSQAVAEGTPPPVKELEKPGLVTAELRPLSNLNPQADKARRWGWVPFLG